MRGGEWRSEAPVEPREAQVGRGRRWRDDQAAVSIYICRLVAREPCVYILASARHGTLYIGVTSDLPTRVWTHKQDLVEGFTKRYGVHTLVWYELHDSMADAITREKQLKRWKRDWKFRLIREFNPGWRDLDEDLA